MKTDGTTRSRTWLARVLATLCAVGLTASPDARGAELVARYALDGDADDSSGNGFHGSDPENTTTFVDDPDRGMVASFDGSGSTLDVSASGYSITERPNFQFAISFWFKPGERDDYRPGGPRDVNPIMGGVGSGVIEVVGHGAWQGMGGTAAYGGIGVNSGGGAGSVAAVADIDVYDGAWHHVVIQWQDPDGVPSDVSLGGGADATVYVDGLLAEDVNAQTYNGNSGQANPRMVLGGPVVYSNGGPADKFYLGLLSEVQFFDGQLTAEEVADLFEGGSIIPEPFEITRIELLPDDMIELTWRSEPDQTYTVLWSQVVDEFPSDVSDDVASDGESTTLRFKNPTVSEGDPDGEPRVFFQVVENASSP